MRRTAFTLIELLSVIAIIAILAAILFPVFASVKAAAKKTAGISNAKQFVTSVLLYSSDADDRFPIYTYNGSYDANPKNPDSTTQVLVQPYLKNTKVLEDPGGIL